MSPKIFKMTSMIMMMMMTTMMMTTAAVSLSYHGRKRRQHKLGKGFNKTAETQLDIRPLHWSCLPELHTVSSVKEMCAPRCLRKVKNLYFETAFISLTV